MCYETDYYPGAKTIVSIARDKLFNIQEYSRHFGVDQPQNISIRLILLLISLLKLQPVSYTLECEL